MANYVYNDIYIYGLSNEIEIPKILGKWCNHESVQWYKFGIHARFRVNIGGGIRVCTNVSV